jgi:ABC-type Na+ transport system ATPase subunit NatA
MKTFSSFFLLELKRLYSKRNIVVFLLFFLLCQYLVQVRINEYKLKLENKAEFHEIERTNGEKFMNYSQYGTFGFRLMFIPPVISAFFSNSAVISELTAFVDSGVRLRIYNSLLGKNLFSDRSGGFKDLAGIILLFGTLIALYFGYDSFRYKEYIKFISSLSSTKPAFFSILFSRLILLNLNFLFIILFSLILMRINGLHLSLNEYINFSVFIFLTVLLLSFFLVVGAIIGCSKSNINAIVAIISVWVALAFLAPGIVTNIVNQRAGRIESDFKVEMDKLQQLIDFENRAIAQAGHFNPKNANSDPERHLVESYWNKEFKEIQNLEKKRNMETLKNAKSFQIFSIFAPTTFYIAMNNEISGLGYGSFSDFYQYTQNLREKFIHYYLQKIFYSNDTKVETFVKNDENIFVSKSRIPSTILFGIILNLLYLAVLFHFSFHRFRKYIFGLPDQRYQELKELEMELMTGKTVVLLTADNGISGQLYNFFTGHDNGFEGVVMLDEEDMAADGNREDFLYLCRPEEIPGDIKVGDFVKFFSRLLYVSKRENAQMYLDLQLDTLEGKLFSQLNDAQKGRILMTAAIKKMSAIYMIHDLARGMPVDFVMEFIDVLNRVKEDGAAILYLSRDVLFASKIADRLTYLLTDPTLPKRIDTYQSM